MSTKKIFTEKHEEKIMQNMNDIKNIKKDLKALFQNQSNHSTRLADLETETTRAKIIRMSLDVSRTGKLNFFDKDIVEELGVTLYLVKKVQKEEGIIRTGGKLKLK